MSRAPLASLAVFLATAPVAMAQVETPTPPTQSLRLVAGLNAAGSVFGDRSATTPSGGHPPTDAVVRFGVLLAVERRILDRGWLGAAAGISQWTEGAGLDAGYFYRRLDLGVTPRFALNRWSFRVVTTELDVALPIGLTRSFVDVPMRRAFDEQIDGSWGWHLGGTLSATVLLNFRRHRSATAFGVRLGVGYLRHAAQRRTTFTPTDATQAPIVEEIDVVDQDLLFTLAGVLAF